MPLPLPDHPITWLFVGDSITHGCLHTAPDRNYVEHVNEVLRWDRGRTTDVLVNSAVSGWRVDDLLERWDFHAGKFDADVVFVMFGTNDATHGEDGVEHFRRGLTEIVDRFEQSGATVVLQVPAPIRAEPSGRAAIEQYRDVVRELAAERGLLVVDHARDWAADEVDSLLNDDIHPNAEGHRRMARRIVATLDE